MRKVIRVDTNGLFLEDILIEDNQELPEDCVDVEIPEGLYLPKFIDGMFVEGLTQTEIDAIKNVVVINPDDELANAISSSTTLEELKSALLGSSGIARVKGRQK